MEKLNEIELADVSARRKMLSIWIKEYFGTQAAFAAAYEINQGELSGLLKTKSFGSKRARAIEAIAKMPHKYLEGGTPANPCNDAFASQLSKLSPEQAATIEEFISQLSERRISDTEAETAIHVMRMSLHQLDADTRSSSRLDIYPSNKRDIEVPAKKL